MPSFQHRFERLELKFVVDEILADRVRRQIAPYCEVDPHSETGRDGKPSGYAIQSLYLDSPGLAFHEAKERGDPDRVKLRVRSYIGSPTATLEVKRRRANVIDKRRFSVTNDLVTRSAMGRADATDVVRGQACDMTEFARLVATSGAGPKLTVSYRREAYESLVDPYARVTFDRGIRVRPTSDWDLTPDDRDWFHFDEHWNNRFATDPVVLELKCETAVPFWMEDVIRQNQLEQASFSKYSVGICLTQLRDGGAIGRSRSLGALS